MGRRGLFLRTSLALYRVLLRVYPEPFRKRFGDQMVADYEELSRALRARRGRVGSLVAWWRVVSDVLHSAPVERRAARRARRDAKVVRSEAGMRKRAIFDVLLDVLREVRLGSRSLLRRPGFAAVAVITLGLAIGANTLLFSVVNGVLIRTLPYPDAQRLVVLGDKRVGESGEVGQASYPDFLDWRERTRLIDAMGVTTTTAVNLTGGAEPLRVLVGLASPDFMRLTGLVPVIGRSFDADEALAGGTPVAVLSHGLWQQAFGSDPGVLDRTIELNGSPVQVVGVLGAGSGTWQTDARLWLPIAPLIGDWVERREVHALNVIGRLAPGASLAAAEREMAGIGAQLREEYPEYNTDRDVGVMSLTDALVGDVRSRVWLLMGTVLVVLVIACANVASLLLARLSARTRELAVRKALGAGRWGVTRVVLTESLLLTLAGGAVGVTLSYLAFGALRGQLEGRLPRADAIALDAPVLGFALLLSLGTGLIFGLLPWFTTRRSEPGSNLGSARGAGARRTRTPGRSALSVIQVAGSVVLLIGAGLLIRSFIALQGQDVGFEPDNLVTVNVSLAGSGRSTEEVVRFYYDLPARIEALPGVLGVSAVNSLPISGGDSNGMVTIDGHPFPLGDEPAASFRRVLPGYFSTMGIPIKYGRGFESTDTGNPMVVVIDETMATRYWDSPADALGARIKVGSPEFEPWLTVVGVAGDVRNVGLATEPRLDTYEPHAQRPWTTMSLFIRTERDPAAILPLVRDIIHEAGGQVPVFGESTIMDRISESLAPRRLVLVLMAGFAALALLISAVGVYGLLSYLVAQRTNEFGIRMALGARRNQVTALVARQGARIVGAGLLLGLAASVLVGNAARSMLHGVGPRDALTYTAVPIILGVVALFACYLPARRATATDPMVALRRSD